MAGAPPGRVAMTGSGAAVVEARVVTFLFPVLIGLSCLFTKQHYVVDLPAGAALGWLAYRVFAGA